MSERDAGRACSSCRARSALLGSLVGRIDQHRHDRHRLDGLLALPDRQLLRALGLAGPNDVIRQSGLRNAPRQAVAATALCRHDPAFPSRLLQLTAPPVLLHMAGENATALALLAAPMVAIVGSRTPTEYGREIARGLAHQLARTGVCVVSGMAMGIDATAHEGALHAGGPTLAIMPGGVDVAYPAGRRSLHRHLVELSAAWAELPAGVTPRRWCFVARNRIIAALAEVTVIIEAQERSGALITAGYARDLGREVGAVPGLVTSDRSAGTNALIRDGAHLVRNAQDVLDLVYGVGVRRAPRDAPHVDARLGALLAHVCRGHTTVEELTRAGVDLRQAQAGLTELELLGCVRRTLSGRYLPVTR